MLDLFEYIYAYNACGHVFAPVGGSFYCRLLKTVVLRWSVDVQLDLF